MTVAPLVVLIVVVVVFCDRTDPYLSKCPESDYISYNRTLLCQGEWEGYLVIKKMYITRASHSLLMFGTIVRLAQCLC